MLFDLRSAGRQRTVKIVYITLALLMGGGLVLFGIGGGGALSGGLLDAITDSGNTGGGGGADRFERQEATATAKARANPTDAAAWAAVARARFNLATAGENFNRDTNTFTDSGRIQLESASRAWERHLQEAGAKPDARVASLMVQVYTALDQPAKAVTAQEVIAEDRNSAGAYASLALLAYEAGQTRKGDLAKKKALDLTEPDMRESLRGQLEAAKTQAASAAGGNQAP